MPHERRAFDTPDVPQLVVVQIALLIERHVQFVESAGRLDDLHRLIDILLAIRSQQHLHRLRDELLLIGAQFADRDAGELSILSLQSDGRFTGSLRDQRLLGLLGIESFEDLVHLLGLIVIDVVLRSLFAVPVNDRATERGFVDAVAVHSQREMPAGQFPFERSRTRLTEDRDAELIKPARVFVHLLLEPFVTLFRSHATNDRANDRLLILVEEVAADLRLRDMPVGVDPLPQFMLKRKAERFLLLIRQQPIEPTDGGLGRTLRRRSCEQSRLSDEHRHRDTRQRRRTSGLQKRTTIKRFAIGARGR